MDDAKRDVVHSWLYKANHDLRAARTLGSGPEPLLDTAIYHCQQAAEKALKAVLVFHDTRVTKTHDRPSLLKLAIPFEPSLSALMPAASRITDYATLYRYPGPKLDPEREEFERALLYAEPVYTLVLHSLPDSAHP